VFTHFLEASFSSIYPALTQLHVEGLVSVRAQEQSGRPDKKVYALTEAGRKALAKAVSVLPAKDKFRSEFLFQMLMSDYLSPEMTLAAIDRQLANLQEDLAGIEECKCAEMPLSGAQFVADYGRAVLTASVKHLEQKRAELFAQLHPQAAE
jgi:DNA-binding PadR family transcriptional regulator